MPKKTTKRLRRIFCPAQEDVTFLAAGLAELGFSSKAIERETGLTAIQVAYRLRIIGVRRSFYRDGKSKLSEKIVRTYLKMAEGVSRDKANRV